MISYTVLFGVLTRILESQFSHRSYVQDQSSRILVQRAQRALRFVVLCCAALRYALHAQMAPCRLCTRFTWHWVAPLRSDPLRLLPVGGDYGRKLRRCSVQDLEVKIRARPAWLLAAHTRTCAPTHTHTHTHTHTRARKTHTHKHAPPQSQKHTHAHKDAHGHAHAHARAHPHPHLPMRTHTHARTHAHTHTHTRTHTRGRARGSMHAAMQARLHAYTVRRHACMRVHTHARMRRHTHVMGPTELGRNRAIM